jgi:hypothetical protein
MIASTRGGLLLTWLWYIREVDPQVLLLTGLTRDGVHLSEERVMGAVNNFRFNETPVGEPSRLAGGPGDRVVGRRAWSRRPRGRCRRTPRTSNVAT